MITSNLNRTGPTRVIFLRNSYEGKLMDLRLDSVIMTDNLITALTSDIDSVIGHCPDLQLVDAAQRITLGL